MSGSGPIVLERLLHLFEVLLWPHLGVAAILWLLGGLLWAWLRWHVQVCEELRAETRLCEELDAECEHLLQRRDSLRSRLEERSAPPALDKPGLTRLRQRLAEGPGLLDSLRRSLETSAQALAVTRARVEGGRGEVSGLNAHTHEARELLHASRGLLASGLRKLEVDGVANEVSDPIARTRGASVEGIDRLKSIERNLQRAEDGLEQGLDAISQIQGRMGSITFSLDDAIARIRGAELVLGDPGNTSAQVLGSATRSLADLESQLAEICAETVATIQQFEELDSELENGADRLAELETSIWSSRDFSGGTAGELGEHLQKNTRLQDSSAGSALELAIGSMAKATARLGGIGVCARENASRLIAERRALHETIVQLHEACRIYAEAIASWSHGLRAKLGLDSDQPDTRWDVAPLDRPPLPKCAEERAPGHHDHLGNGHASDWIERELELFQLRARLKEMTDRLQLDAVEASGWRTRVAELEGKADRAKQGEVGSPFTRELREKMANLEDHRKKKGDHESKS